MIYNTNRSNKSGIYWLTGRPCSGKTTLARAVKDNLAKELPIALLDGDIVRDMLPPLGFTRADRSLQLGRHGFYCATATEAWLYSHLLFGVSIRRGAPICIYIM